MEVEDAPSLANSWRDLLLDTGFGFYAASIKNKTSRVLTFNKQEIDNEGNTIIQNRIDLILSKTSNKPSAWAYYDKNGRRVSTGNLIVDLIALIDFV